MQRLLAISIILGTALALSGVFASATHENTLPDNAIAVAPATGSLETAPASAAAAMDITAASGTFGVKPAEARTAKPVRDTGTSPRMPAIIQFKPKSVTLGATGRKSAPPARAAGTDNAAARKSPTRIASTTAPPATPASAASAGSSTGPRGSAGADTAAAVAASRSAGASTGAARSSGGDAAASAAPTVLRTPNDTCMGSSGAAGQGADFGFSAGTTWRDSNCILLKNARALLAQGDPKAAKIRLCMDEDNALAFEVVGEPCPPALKSSQLAAAKLNQWNTGRSRSIAAAPTKTKSADAAPAIAPGSVRDFIANAGNRVLFGFNQYNVSPDAAKTLDKQAAWLKRHAETTAVVEGHADARGPEKYNLALGERRASAIRDYLVGKGVAAERIKTISYGEARPVAQGETEAAWSQNRRGVTFILNADGTTRAIPVSAAPDNFQSTLAGGGKPAADNGPLGLSYSAVEDDIE